MSEGMREDFEVFAVDQGLCIEPYGASYVDEKTHTAWITWIAAKSATKPNEQTEYEEGTLGHTLGIPYKSAATCRAERLERVIVNLVDQFDKNNYGIRSIDAPGHSHDVPGIWDDDNGDMSGKPCDFCAAWREACAIHDASKNEA